MTTSTIPRLGDTIVIEPYNGPSIQKFERVCDEIRTGYLSFETDGTKEVLENLIRFHNNYSGAHKIVDVRHPTGVRFGDSYKGEELRDADYQVTENNILRTSVFAANTMPRVRFLVPASED